MSTCHLQPSSPDREVGGKPAAPQGRRVLSSLAVLLYGLYGDGAHWHCRVVPWHGIYRMRHPLLSLVEGRIQGPGNLACALRCDKGFFVTEAPNELH